MTILIVLGTMAFILGLSWVVHFLSYKILKGRILRRQVWDLNVCCGKTDGGGVNADIVRHADVPRFIRIADIYNLPFRDGQFASVLCSHTIEHVDDPGRFFEELRRVGREVTIVLPPLWDFTAALNVLEHRWVFLTVRKVHRKLPPFVRLPLARTIQRIGKQRIKA